MFDDRLIQMLRQAAIELGRESDVLAETLSIVRRAQESLENLAQMAEGMRNGDEILIDADEVCEEAGGNWAEEPESSTVRAGDTAIPPEIISSEGYSLVEKALRDSELTKQNRLMEKVRAFAQANGGQIKPVEASRLFCKLGLSDADPRNLAGYMTKEMGKTREFERVGEARSGIYRWLMFEGEATEEEDGPMIHEGNGRSEFSVREEVPGIIPGPSGAEVVNTPYMTVGLWGAAVVRLWWTAVVR